MNNIQSVGNFALKNQPIPETETKQNVRRVNFKAENDRFVRQGQPRTPACGKSVIPRYLIIFGSHFTVLELIPAP